MMNNNFESRSLLDGNDDHGGSEAKVPNKPDPQFSKLPRILAFGLLFFFVIDIVAFASTARLLLNVTSAIPNPDTMEFRNPYIGLDELYAQGEIKASQHSRIINEPRLAAQISFIEQEKVSPIDSHRWHSDFGVLSPPDRRLQVNSKIRTIVQFNVLDYGMEKCAIAVRLPSRGESLPHAYSLPLHKDTVSLNVCRLGSSRPLDERTISWSKRPSCAQDLGTLEARVGEETQMESFDCKSGSFLAYEVSCADPDTACNVDVWTNHNATWGLFINQYQTL